jgi:hypothetical protein
MISQSFAFCPMHIIFEYWFLATVISMREMLFHLFAERVVLAANAQSDSRRNNSPYW